MDINNLVKEAIKGNRQAYGEIYRYFLPKIYRFVYFQVYEKDEASDLTQETFLKAWKALPDFHTDAGTFQSFLFRVAKNLTIDYFRKKKEVILNNLPEIESTDNTEELIDRDLNTKMISNVLVNLQQEEKQIIILRYFEDLPFAEIADITGIHEGNLRVKTHRILDKLKKEIKRG